MKPPSNKYRGIRFEMPMYRKYIKPLGFLTEEKECHALWHYYVTARLVYETHVETPIVLEGDADPVTNFKQLFMSIAFTYQVQPEHMVKFWGNIDMQCHMLQLPKLPDMDIYRFNKVPEIRTQ